MGDNAIVATGAVVAKRTQIGAGEIWGGVPAKLFDHVCAQPRAPG